MRLRSKVFRLSATPLEYGYQNKATVEQGNRVDYEPVLLREH